MGECSNSLLHYQYFQYVFLFSNCCHVGRNLGVRYSHCVRREGWKLILKGRTCKVNINNTTTASMFRPNRKDYLRSQEYEVTPNTGSLVNKALDTSRAVTNDSSITNCRGPFASFWWSCYSKVNLTECILMIRKQFRVLVVFRKTHGE